MEKVVKETQSSTRARDLVFIVGPAGAGKTTAALNLRIQLHKNLPGIIRYLPGDVFGQIFFPWNATKDELDKKYSCLIATLKHLMRAEKEIVIVVDDLLRRQSDIDRILTLCKQQNMRFHIFKIDLSLEEVQKRNASRSGWTKAPKKRIQAAFEMSEKIRYPSCHVVNGTLSQNRIASRISRDFFAKTKLASPI